MDVKRTSSDVAVVLKRVTELHCADNLDDLEAQKDALRRQIAAERAEFDALFRADVEGLRVLSGEQGIDDQKGQPESFVDLSAARKLKLDVGGVMYTTTAGTLRNVPGSKLDKMFSGRFPISDYYDAADVDDNTIFIDRDGMVFREVLNYLRDIRAYVLPSNADELRMLLLEARYYGLNDLANLIAPPFCKTISIDSSVLDEPMKHTLMKMIMVDKNAGGSVRGQRIHTHVAGSVNAGFDTALAHRSDVVVVVESSNGCVFGAYIRDLVGTRAHTGPTGHYTMGHPDNFLFSLGWRGELTPPLKLLASRRNKNVYVSGEGLHMWTDLVVSCSPSAAHTRTCSPSKYCTVAPGYQLPPCESLRDGTLCGSPGTARYTARKTEVFSLFISPA